MNHPSSSATRLDEGRCVNDDSVTGARRGISANNTSCRLREQKMTKPRSHALTALGTAALAVPGARADEVKGATLYGNMTTVT